MAKQVLASSLSFHASFLLPTEALLSDIVDCILDRFVAKGHWDEGPVGPLTEACMCLAEPLSPCFSLPWEMGGLQRACRYSRTVK